MKQSLSTDLASSVLGRGLAAVLLFVFTPVYIRIIGVDSYGLMSLYATVLATCLFLDQAISPIVARRFAQSAATPAGPDENRDTMRTVESLALAMGIGLALVVFIASEWASTNIVGSTALSRDEVTHAIQLMALMLLFQWPSFVYGAALAGLGDQTAANLIRSAATLAQWAGGAVMLHTIHSSIFVLFAWQSLCFLALTVALRRRLSSNLPSGTRTARFSPAILRAGWRFSGGTLIIGITGTILTQADKFLISRSTSLAAFAGYALAVTLTSTVSAFVAQPVMSIAFPHFTRLVSLGDRPGGEAKLIAEYRRWTQVIVAVVIPVVGAMVFDGAALLQLWIGRHGHAALNAVEYVPWIAFGTLFNVLMLLPFNLQLAHGWTSLSVVKNLVILPFFLAFLVIEIPRIGPLAGGIAWFAVNLSYYLFEVPLMHRRLLKRTMWRWWLADTAAPCVFGLALFYLSKIAIADKFGDNHPLLQCLFSALVVGLALFAALPAARAQALSLLKGATPLPPDPNLS